MVLNCGGIVSVFSGRKDKNQRKRWEFFKNNCKNSSSNSLARALKAQTEDIFVLLLNGAFFSYWKENSYEIVECVFIFFIIFTQTLSRATQKFPAFITACRICIQFGMDYAQLHRHCAATWSISMGCALVSISYRKNQFIPIRIHRKINICKQIHGIFHCIFLLLSFQFSFVAEVFASYVKFMRSCSASSQIDRYFFLLSDLHALNYFFYCCISFAIKLHDAKIDSNDPVYL